MHNPTIGADALCAYKTLCLVCLTGAHQLPYIFAGHSYTHELQSIVNECYCGHRDLARNWKEAATRHQCDLYSRFLKHRLFDGMDDGWKQPAANHHTIAARAFIYSNIWDRCPERSVVDRSCIKSHWSMCGYIYKGNPDVSALSVSFVCLQMWSYGIINAVFEYIEWEKWDLLAHTPYDLNLPTPKPPRSQKPDHRHLFGDLMHTHKTHFTYCPIFWRAAFGPFE